ncbi:hypothetical protein Tco_0474121 [Tanacetum coccineum]
MNWFCKKQGIKELTQKDLEGPAFEIVKVFYPNVIHLQYQMEECHKLLTDKVDDAIIRYGSKGGRPALSISKMKAACYLDVGLEQMTHMRILSFVRIEVFSLYGYDYMKTIVLRRADLNEYIIAERDFKYLYPSDFEDLYLLNLQGHLNHLPPNDKKILSTAVNLWIRNLVIRQRHDFTVIESPRAVTFRDKYGVQMIMRFNEIHKFSDSTLQQIDEALDYRVKEFKWVFNSLVHSLRVLSTLRRFGLRMASTAAKPCQGDSSEFYLITGILDGSSCFCNSDACYYDPEKCEHSGPKVITSQEGNTSQQG